MTAGSVALWIGIPAGALWAASKLTETGAEHFVVALPMTIAGMAIFAPLLIWLNRLFMRVRYATPAPADEAEEDEQHPPRGPLEPLLVGSLVLAIVASLVWFFIFAENPCSCAAC